MSATATLENMPPAQATPLHHHRYDSLDALRGFAMLWMAGFHLCFDLNQYDLIPPQNFNHQPLWLHQRTAIVSLFLLCAGAAQALNWGHGQGARFTPAFWRRWLQVAVCAALVSAGSAFMFPGAWISFGVLHGMAVMLLILRGMAPFLAPGSVPFVLPCAVPAGAPSSVLSTAPAVTARFSLAAWWCWPLALLLLSMPRWLQHPFFDTRATNWLGLVTRKPITVDWVPLLPWLGMMLLGFALGRVLLARQTGKAGLSAQARKWAVLFGALATLGRWPLSFYMVHQPVLLGAIEAGRWLRWW
jgi:uncharacterized membrane protein